MDALFRNLSHGSQAEHLESAGIGEDPLMPVHEIMKSAGFPDQFRAGTEKEMVRIGQDNLGAHVFQFLRRHRLHRSLGAYGHEHRCFEGAVGRMKKACSGSCFLIFCNEFVVDNHRGFLI